MARKEREPAPAPARDLHIQQGSKCRLTHAVLIDGQLAFELGETVFIDSVEPNPARPEYKFVVTSKRLNFRQFQLREEDLEIFVPEQVPVSRARKAWWWVGEHKWLLIGSATAIIVVVLGISTYLNYHFKWDPRQGTTTADFTGIQGFTSGSAIATSGGTAGDSLYKFTGSGWKEITRLEKYRIIDFAGSDPDHVWIAASDGRIYYFDGKALTMQLDTNQVVGADYWHDQLLSIYAADATHVWAVGAYLASPSTNWGLANMQKDASGIVYFYDGTSWKAQWFLNEPKSALETVAGADARHVWTGGASGIMYFFNGSAWSPQWESGMDISNLSASDPQSAWAAAKKTTTNTEVCSCSNGAWVLNGKAGNVAVFDISARDQDTLWVSGTESADYQKDDIKNQYTVLWTTDGSDWTPVQMPVGAQPTPGQVSGVKGGVWLLASGKAWFGSKKLF